MKNRKLTFYSFFSKFSYLDNYGFTVGLFHRIVRKIIPKVTDKGTFEDLLSKSKCISEDCETALEVVLNLLTDETSREQISRELDNAIKALSHKIISFGFDHEIKSKYDRLSIDNSSYHLLSALLARFSTNDSGLNDDLRSSLVDIEKTVFELRKEKNQIGTSLHLTVLTKRVLEHINRAYDLVKLREDLDSKDKWSLIIKGYLSYNKSRNSLRKYLSSHLDLLALEVVEHTSNQGGKYIADSYVEYKGFFKKGLLGGAIISLFALMKIYIDTLGMTNIPRAISYSLNYALCFIVVKYAGGVIATKQPAMTASTIIKYIDSNNNLELGSKQDIIHLLRKVFRSQFISLIGNFLMALTIASGITLFLKLDFMDFPLSAQKAEYLVNQVRPIDGGAFFYASIAGVFLALSGLISGYFDNKVTASNLSSRLLYNPALSKILAKSKRQAVARFFHDNLGILAGNVSLGFLLGSVFLLSPIVPFVLDIRHIAFSAANMGYALLSSSFSASAIVIALLSVLLIGLVNFFVSFSLTFFIALKSRSITFRELSQLLKFSLRDMITHPLHYLVYKSVR